MQLKNIIASFMLGLMLVCNNDSVLAASESNIDNYIDTSQYIEDLQVQVNDLYNEVGSKLNLDPRYIKMIHLVAGGGVVYADKRPNVKSELTVESMKAPFDIDRANQKYEIEADWIECPDETVIRPNKYYLPDAALSVSSEVVLIMNERNKCNRGEMQRYFNALRSDVKQNIIFYESILKYIGCSDKEIDSFYTSYEQMTYKKSSNENVIENINGVYTIKDKFKEIFEYNGISDEYALKTLGILLSFDEKLAISNSPDSIKDEYLLPYKLHYTSRENMMLAAMSLVGKVRYVWGGGHLGPSSIEGINPAWEAFYKAYPSNENEEGYGTCIQPSNCWCPVHGKVESENGCLDTETIYYDLNEYIDSRSEVMDITDLEDEKYERLILNAVDIEHGILGHRLDGLDCSGYTSWIYNQISENRKYDAGARSFISAGNLDSIEYGDDLLPGDVFAWNTHIVLVVGKVSDNSKAYIVLEQSPNNVQFSLMYYTGASFDDMKLGTQIAKQANKLFGNINSNSIHSYNMDRCGFYKDDEDNEQRYAEIGRLSEWFRDENIIIGKYNRRLKDMVARDIIQYIIDNIDKRYLSGIMEYDEELFDIT